MENTMGKRIRKPQKKISWFVFSFFIFVFTKLKSIFLVFQASKFGITLISMGVSLGSYAVFYGWKFAALIIYHIFIHEMGHVIAAKHKKIPVSPAVFIPFVGALIGMKEQPKHAKDESYMAYGGPLAGLIATLALIPLYLLTQDPLWMLGIQLGAILNLFNLIPISPLDGGRIVSVLSSHIWLGALLLMTPALFYWHSPILGLIIILGWISWWNRARSNFSYQVSMAKINSAQLQKKQFEDANTLCFGGTEEEGYPHFREFNQHLLTDASRVLTRHSQSKRWYIPFFQDKQRMAKEVNHFETQLYTKCIYARDDEGNFMLDFPNIIARLDDEINTVQQEATRYKTYYSSTLQDKLKVISLYLVLAFVLSGLYIWSIGIL